MARFCPQIYGAAESDPERSEIHGKGCFRGRSLNRIRAGFNMLSILVTWALENARDFGFHAEQGYGLKGRTAFSIYKFTKKDKGFWQ